MGRRGNEGGRNKVCRRARDAEKKVEIEGTKDKDRVLICKQKCTKIQGTECVALIVIVIIIIIIVHVSRERSLKKRTLTKIISPSWKSLTRAKN